MEVLFQYPVQIEEWKHDGFERFLGQNSQSLYYSMGLTNPDLFNQCLYFNVKVHNTYTNSLHGIVFSARTYSCFKIRYEREAPTVEDLFSLLTIAGFEYAKTFHEKTRQTNLLHHNIPKPKLGDVRTVIQECIDIWDAQSKAFKAKGRKHLVSFRDLPEIPEHKRFTGETPFTVEQFISHKLHMKQSIDESEQRIFEELSAFYVELNEKLKTINYSNFTSDDLVAFENYVFYAFNFVALISNDLTINKVFRAVTNDLVLDENQRITNIKYLKYPSLDIVKSKGLFNRANTSKSTVFYSADSIDAALKEARPVLNKLVTVGIWVPNKVKTFVSYPIIHHEEAIVANKNVAKAFENAKVEENSYHPLFLKYTHYFIKLLAREYAKPALSKFEYLISALFSERIFETNDLNPAFNFECILYPSVGNELQTENIAIKPNVLDTDFRLTKVLEFEIEETYYDRPSNHINPEIISVAKIKNLVVTEKITDSGRIIWE